MGVLIGLLWGVVGGALVLIAPAWPVALAALQIAAVATIAIVVAGRARRHDPADREWRAVATAAGTAWRAIDESILDSAIDGVGGTVGGWSRMLRRAQPDVARVSLLVMLIGLLTMIGYVLWQ